MLLEVLDLLHHLVDDFVIVLKWITILVQTNEYLVAEVCTDIAIIEPVGERGLNVYQFLNLSGFLASILHLSLRINPFSSLSSPYTKLYLSRKCIKIS